jgi:tRNA-specific 2-thiouridylase
MGICFIGKRAMRDFLAEYIPLHPGPFVEVESRAVIAQHDAWESWTMGQKAAISGAKNKLYVCGKSAAQVAREGEPPLTDAAAAPHAVFVCEGNNHPALRFDDLYLDAPQWIAADEPAQLAVPVPAGAGAADGAGGAATATLSAMRVCVKVRSGNERVMATLWKSTHAQAIAPAAAAAATAPPTSPGAAVTYRVEFSSPQIAIAPGQCCVLYDESGRRCLGQGRIQRAGLSHWQQRKTHANTDASQAEA